LFRAKGSGNIRIFRSNRKIDANDAETHFLCALPIVLACRCYRVTPGQDVFVRQIGGRGRFRTRDKDGGQTIRSAISENPLLYTDCTALSFIEPELLPIKVLHCGNREFRIFLRKIVENIYFCSHPEKDVDFAESRLLSHKPRKSVKRCDLCRYAMK